MDHHSGLLFWILLGCLAQIQAENASTYHIQGEIQEDTAYIQVHTPATALRQIISFDVRFPIEQCCPLLRLTWDYPVMRCFDDDWVKSQQAYNINAYFIFKPGAGREADSTKYQCNQLDEKYIQCTGVTDALHERPRAFELAFGHYCSQSHKSVKGLLYNVTIETANEASCEIMRNDNPCSKYFKYAAFPNLFGYTAKESVLSLFDTIKLFAGNCFDWTTGGLAICHSLFFACDGPGPYKEFPIACREICLDLVKSCSEVFPRVKYMGCLYYPTKTESPTCVDSMPTCPMPPSINNGKLLSEETNYTAGSKVKYTCDSGYLMTGDEYSECKFTGKWADPPVCDNKLIIIVCGAIGGAMLLAIAIVVTVHYVRKKRKAMQEMMNIHLSENPDLKRNKEKDAFVSYFDEGHDPSPQKDFVKETLIPELEELNDPTFKLIVHGRDFPAATDISHSIDNAIRNSNAIIILMSKEYVESAWCRYEFEKAFYETKSDEAFRMIVIMMESVENLKNLTSYMKHFLTTKTYLTIDDPELWPKIRRILRAVRPDDAADNAADNMDDHRGNTVDIELGAYGQDVDVDDREFLA